MLLRWSIVIIGCAALLAVGCAGTENAQAVRHLSLAEFSGAAEGESVGSRPAEMEMETRADAEGGSAATRIVVEPRPIVEVPADGRRLDPAPASASVSVRAAAVGEQRVVDSLVGQVNGKPIYADAFFEPIEDQLVALARELPPQQFEPKAAEIVIFNLQQTVLDELFLAEAEANLSIEQQQGIFHWLRQVQEQVISGAGGTRSAAEKRIREEEGLGIEEFVRGLKDQTLIRELVQEKIESRVIVSWRDKQREYERRYQEFNPPPIAHVYRIALHGQRDADVIDLVKVQLESGEPFGNVAEAAGIPERGRWQSFEVGDAGIEATELVGSVRQRLADLDVGETTAPFQVGAYVWWLHLQSIEQPEGRSLYDPVVQRRLANEIRARRLMVERDRYVRSLLEGGVYDEMSEMAQRLVTLAQARYGP